MAITVRYFASLRERMGRGEDRLHPPLPATVEEVWSQVGGGEPLAGNLLTAVNLEYVDPITASRTVTRWLSSPPSLAADPSRAGRAPAGCGAQRLLLAGGK